MSKEKKRNDSNGLGRCPAGTDVGLFGHATDFVDGFVAGFIYASACDVLVERTLEINRMLETMTEDEKELLPTLKEDLEDIDAKWLLATAMFSIEA